ncbi:MAG TPA: sigma-54 dependent transcriptional regulator [Blastocatellia bacterium]|nr:sigma-54 dependent transcriptional regulator [Blastocatellia bacterium]
MRKSSASGMGMAQELSEIQLVNGFHQTVESQSAIRLNGAGPDQAFAPCVTRPEAFSSIVRASRAMDEIINKIKCESDSEAPMLITGETGVGKELIARAVHAVSPRHTGEFIPFNCGGATPELIASELFGYRRGAFTGADRDYKGVIRAANGGTLLLDEIGELPLAAQPKLLRFLQEGEVHPLGEARPVKANVRVIAATNRDLEADVRAGQFRDDLFWRLNVLWVHIPPLRERREDIRPLAEHFLRQRLQETREQGLQLSDEAWALLLDHHWPGNVRQLAAVAHRLTALASNGESIGKEIALAAIRTGICAPPPAAAMVGDNFIIDAHLSYHERLEELERQSIIRALNETGDNITQAAKTLGMCRNGLKNGIERLGIKITNHD